MIYQDIDPQYHCDIGGSMLDICLDNFDYVIATPPCNWWSRLNMNRLNSVYAWSSLSLLPLIIIKLKKECDQKPFIIENVINRKRFEYMGIYQLCVGLKVIEIGRHTYITNVMDWNPHDLNQHFDFKKGGILVNNDGYSQGGSNVHIVIDDWLSHIKA